MGISQTILDHFYFRDDLSAFSAFSRLVYVRVQCRRAIVRMLVLCNIPSNTAEAIIVARCGC